MANESYWTIIMYILYDNEIYDKFENFVSECKTCDCNNKKAIDLPLDKLSILLKEFLDSNNDIDNNVKKELLSYCNKIA